MEFLILLFFAIVIFVQIKLKFSKNNKIHDFLEEEHILDFTPLKEIDKNYFFKSTINLDILNSNCSTKYENLLEEFLISNEKKMIHFETEQTNTELKEKFGTSNLNTIAEYENNYRNYFRILNDMSQELINNNEYEIAKYILQFLIHNKSEFSKTYTLLIDIYKETSTLDLDKFKSELDKNEVLRENKILKNMVYKEF